MTHDVEAPAASFRIGEWRVAPEPCEISGQGERVHLEPKVMEVLVHLARRGGEVVSKQELVDRVWRVQAVSDSRLTRVIADLRQALGDTVGDPRYIETIPTRGYRLVAPVEAIPERDSAGLTQTSGFKLEVGGRDYPLNEGANVLGRGSDADVRIDSEWVSRVHARVVVQGDSADLEDLGSKNGTYVGGRRLTGPVELHDGDEFSIGRGVVVIRFVTAIGSTRTETAIDSMDG